MAGFTLGLAGHSFAVEPLFDSTAHYCAAYPALGQPEITLAVTREELEAQQQRLLEEALAEGLKPRTFSDPFLERAVLQRKAADYLRPFGIFLFHGSTVAVDGKAYLFTALCGTGKSTHTRLWRQVLGPRAVMINDDKPLLALTAAGVIAWGTPWSGKHGLDTNCSAPLAGVCVLARGRENQIAPLLPAQALPFLKTQAEPEDGPLVEKLAKTVPLWHMFCTPTLEAAEMAYRTMSGTALTAASRPGCTDCF